jgi:hypothetical protein
LRAAGHETVEAQIRKVWGDFMGRRADARPRDDLFTLRCKRVERMYKFLAAENHEVAKVQDLTEAHARALLARWRREHLSPATIRSQWSMLRVWAEAIGKPGMIKSLSTYWKEAPKATKAKVTSMGPGRHQDDRLIAELFKSKDRTHYWIERTCHVLRISVQEALELSPNNVAENASVTAKFSRALEADPAGCKQLIEGLQEFLTQCDRTKLLWIDASAGHALRKHENHLAYVRRKLRVDDEIGDLMMP